MNSDMAITHGDLLLQRVHKHNSLDHLKPPAGSRPGSAARPRSAASSKRAPSGSRPPSSMSRTNSRTSTKPPPSAQLSYRSNPEKTDLQKAIDGDTGPAMIGVSSYPYSRPQSAYKEDFEMLVASTITHPYIRTTDMTEGSSPHNLLTGSNFAPTYDYWASEYKRTYQAKSYKQSFNAKAMGLRSEEMLFVG